MSTGTGLLPAQNGTGHLAEDCSLDTRVLEQVVVGGDLSKLNSQQRLEWYQARCAAAGLDPRAQPFQYLQLNGKLVLYAAKAATDQLISNRRLTVEIVDRQYVSDLGIYEARCRVTSPDGRHVEDVAALSVSGLKGEALCNAVMKCVTKAKRRTVLSACGLGMLDETEIETIPGATTRQEPTPAQSLPAPPRNNSGHGRGQYASPEQIKTYKEKVQAYLDKRNAAWLDRWTAPDGSIPEGCKDLCNLFQADGHLLKWAVETQRLDQTIVPEEAKMRQLAAYVAIVWHREDDGKKAIGAELKRYCDEQEQRQIEVIKKKNPHLFQEDSDDITDIDLDEISSTEGGRDG